MVRSGDRISYGGAGRSNVTISKSFAVGKFDVTFDQWAACVSGGGCTDNRSPRDEGWGKGTRPVIHVSWDNAQEYVKWLSRKTGKGYRLLSEAEWEYAARAGTQTRYFWGDTLGKIAPTVTSVAANGKSNQRLWGPSHLMPLACTIWRATCGSGPRIAGTRITKTDLATSKR